MKRIAVLVAGLATFMLVSTALARIPDDQTPGQYVAVDTTQFRQLTALKRPLPPLKLPDIPALTRALLKEPDRRVLAKQRIASSRVLRFWENRGSWIMAPRKEKCWEVPWQRSCTVARASWRLHTKLHEVAERRLFYELPVPNDWATSIRVIQRVFPGTDRWLFSCSDAEGGHGDFVVYGGGSYYPGAEYDDTFHGDMVGGQMQYMWGTFKGHYRHGLEALRKKGFNIRMPAVNDVMAWRMPMGQAIAAGWARWSGNDDSHWSASFGNGC